MKTATISFRTLGCRLNQAETAAMRAELESAGCNTTQSGDPADICVIHSCAITANAERDSLRAARSAKRLNPSGLVVMTGCLAELKGDAAQTERGADLVVRRKHKYKLFDILLKRGLCLKNHIEYPRRTTIAIPRFETTRAVVKIQDGCDFRCAYCVVPKARGLPRSRPINEIIEEVTGLGEAGYREVVLTGANTGCYYDRGKKLTDLLERLESLPVVDRVRISSIEVSTVEHAVIDFMSQSTKLCRFLHLPLQSGDDRILRSMGRRYTAQQYRTLVEYAWKKLGSFGLGTDIIAGFPGEDESAFSATERLIHECPFNNLHVFGYSMRPGTRASKMSDQINNEVKKKRVERLQCLSRKKRADFAKSQIGTEACVLVESIDSTGCGLGWTEKYLRAKVSGETCRVNQIVRFVTEHVDGDTLIGNAREKICQSNKNSANR